MTESKRLAKKILELLNGALPGFDTLWENTSGEVQRGVRKDIEALLDDTVAPSANPLPRKS